MGICAVSYTHLDVYKRQEEELKAHNLPTQLTKQEVLDIAIIRYELNTNSFKKYMPVTRCV